MAVIILITHQCLISAWSGDKKSGAGKRVYEGGKVNFDIVTADVCVLRCFLATTPEANYLRFHARVDRRVLQPSHIQLHTAQKFQRRQGMYALRNIDAPPCNHFCSGRVISITYSECMFVALSIQHAICAVSDCRDCFLIVS